VVVTEKGEQQCDDVKQCKRAVEKSQWWRYDALNKQTKPTIDPSLL